jgi:hypothetical protein
MRSASPGRPDAVGCLGGGGATGKLRLPVLPEHGVVLSPVKLWVLAMLAPKAGLRVGSGPAASGEFDRACARDAGGMAGRDGGTGALIEPRNMDQQVIPVAPPPLLD